MFQQQYSYLQCLNFPQNSLTGTQRKEKNIATKNTPFGGWTAEIAKIHIKGLVNVLKLE